MAKVTREKPKPTKFKFTPEFQQNILQFIIHDNNGSQALSIISENNFELVEHNLIALALKRFYKRARRIPGHVVFKEYLRKMLSSREIKSMVSSEDASAIYQITDKIYREVPKDGDIIFEECIKFARYVKLKDVIESADILNYDSYEHLHNSVRQAISLGSEYKQDNVTHLMADLKKRQTRRSTALDVFPTPFWQVNELTNSGGYAAGSLITIIGRAKRFKTGMLVNIARSYLRLRKRVVYFDFENGKESLSLRAEQALGKKTRQEILSGAFDGDLQKIARKYKRLGAELTIIRCTSKYTVNDLQNELDKLYQNQGLKYNVAMIDYAGLMASTNFDKEDVTRISNVYMNIKDWALENKLETVYTANHVTRDAAKARETTKYLPSDIAKCIDIHRHVDALFGLNEDEHEQANGVLRMELIDQRDGKPEGRAFFWVDYERQLAKEFTKVEFKAYQEQVESAYGGDKQEESKDDKKYQRNGSPSGGRRAKNTEDID